jgi:hypothetical protein
LTTRIECSQFPPDNDQPKPIETRREDGHHSSRFTYSTPDPRRQARRHHLG